MVKVRGAVYLTLIWLFLLLPGIAQNSIDDKVSVKLSSNTIALDETALLTVSVTGSADNVDVPLPTTRGGGLQFTPAGRRYNMTSINGQTNSSIEFDYLVTPIQAGRHLIEPISGTVAGLPFNTEGLRLEVTAANGSSSSGTGWRSQNRNRSQAWDPNSQFWPNTPDPRGDDVILEADLEPQVVYQHQPIYYNLKLLTAVQLLSDPRYNPIAPTGFLRLQFDQENGSTERSGRYYSVSSVKTAFFPLTAGDYTFPSTDVQVTPGAFALPKILKTGEKKITVLPLPSAGRPTSFTGAVGQNFEIRARLKTSEIQQGQTADLEITVQGDGHLELVPYPYLPDWPGLDKKQTASPSTTQVKDDAIVSRRTYNFRIKPSKDGTFDLSNIALAYFNPQEKRYEVVKHPSLKLKVTANQNAPSESTETAAETRESDRPVEAPGPQNGTLPQRPDGALVGGILLLLAGGLLAKPGKRGFRGTRPGSKKVGPNLRHHSMKDLLRSLTSLAPGADAKARAEHLSAQGWNAESIGKLEDLKLRASRAEFGSAQAADGVALERLDTELRELLKGKKR